MRYRRWSAKREAARLAKYIPLFSLDSDKEKEAEPEKTKAKRKDKAKDKD